MASNGWFPLQLFLWQFQLVINSNPSAGKHREAENIIRESLEGSSELDTVAYNTFIKAMLETGINHLNYFLKQHMRNNACIEP